MIPFSSALLLSGKSQVVQDFTIAGTYSSISPPAGATLLTIECIGAGYGAWYDGEGMGYTGGGGAYSRSVVTAQPVKVEVGRKGQANNLYPAQPSKVTSASVNAILCIANAGSFLSGGAAETIYAQTSYKGGDGASVYTGGGGQGAYGGGGAGGPQGPGGNGGPFLRGTSGGTPGGRGGCPASQNDSANGVGEAFGGGGGLWGVALSGTTNYDGGGGFVRLTWT